MSTATIHIGRRSLALNMANLKAIADEVLMSEQAPSPVTITAIVPAPRPGDDTPVSRISVGAIAAGIALTATMDEAPRAPRRGAAPETGDTRGARPVSVTTTARFPLSPVWLKSLAHCDPLADYQAIALIALIGAIQAAGTRPGALRGEGSKRARRCHETGRVLGYFEAVILSFPENGEAPRPRAPELVMQSLMKQFWGFANGDTSANPRRFGMPGSLSYLRMLDTVEGQALAAFWTPTACALGVRFSDNSVFRRYM